MDKDKIVGTRGSKLAVVQTEIVVDLLERKFPDRHFTVKKITTQGDRNLKDSLQKIGGKGVFVKEIEQELYDHTIDFAVHSLKDVTPKLSDGLMIGAVLRRASPYDCLITPHQISNFAELPKGARIGTNSSRRQGQLLNARPDLQIVPIRGNVETRIKKIATEDLFGVVLAVSGLKRLGVDLSVYTQLSLKDVIIPAAGQGAIAVECRIDDSDTRQVLAAINDKETRDCVTIERNFLGQLGGSCNFPIGSFATKQDDEYAFEGLVASNDGKQLFKKQAHQKSIENFGEQIADELIAVGALKLIQS
ncbi:hydroxymethylbilane synthase [Lentilactobacillus kisonensis]|uniref:Porphobilinogen deaminase n=2 Tax=Lentilactobacillus kisonensis TaxID=481722 RepID=H1LK34_9LACO|nr:hydroxymethylbilane synthase [Lentilactobacillus kisonensis]EHO47974.1 hydroxymethylbilane synthase [Lentilactobacillus kisonensis F0435]KRL21620.1 hydroxymethylbilane synthase [Lentilactobacillus kisonensis DSM 19906 = JCM 15041]